MGQSVTKSRIQKAPIYDPRDQTQREAMAAWHREGVAVTDVYDVIEVIGHGHMGEVCSVARKKEKRGSHVNNISPPTTPPRASSSGTLGTSRSSSRSPLGNLRKWSVSSPSHGKTGNPYHSVAPRSLTNQDSGHNSDKLVCFKKEMDLLECQTSEDSMDSSSSRNHRRLYACKTVRTARVKSGQLDELLNEISIMRTLDHPYILELFEVYQVKRKLWLITELCTGGDLASRTLDEPEVAVVMEQILSAVAYIHRRGVCHRDIKLENILFEHPGPEAGIKLIDFGLSQKFTRGTKMRRACGTAYTVSPELCKGGNGGYTEKTDIWSVGVVAFVLLSGDFPFLTDEAELKDELKLERLSHAKYIYGPAWKERNVSVKAKEFVHGCLRRHPAVRWTASEALSFVQNTWIPMLEEVEYERSSLDTSRSSNGFPEDCNVLESMEEPLPRSPSSKVLLRSISSKRRGRTESIEAVSMDDFKRFCSYGLMKKTILMTIAFTMDKSSLGKLKELFLTIDTESTGTISILELREALQQIDSDLDEDTVARVFDGIDQDHSGQIHYAEFLAAIAESQGLITMERLAEAFDRIDVEGKGYISRGNLRFLLGNDYDEALVDNMLNEADFKKNGQVDYDEFLRLMFQDPAKGVDAVGFHRSDSELSFLTESLRS